MQVVPVPTPNLLCFFPSGGVHLLTEKCLWNTTYKLVPLKTTDEYLGRLLNALCASFLLLTAAAKEHKFLLVMIGYLGCFCFLLPSIGGDAFI